MKKKNKRKNQKEKNYKKIKLETKKQNVYYQTKVDVDQYFVQVWKYFF
jgi:hypothetical protein